MTIEPVSILKEKHIVLGVSGSIAAYKAADLASKLTQLGAVIDVIMTEAAQKFVTPLTFQAITGRPVYTNLWKNEDAGLPTHIAHVGLGEKADLVVIAPATANTIAHLAHGFADNLLTITALAARCPLIVAPAMDGGMYEHPATQVNLALLAERGVTILEPEVGRFASGLSGMGRLPDTVTILGKIRQVLSAKGLLSKRKVLITAGGTREAIDPVRYISNHSSGKQGYALAQAAVDAGADVVLISTVNLPIPVGVRLIVVDSAASMLQAVLEESSNADILIMAAAVADFRSATIAEHKIKKKGEADEELVLRLTKNPDILLEVKQYRATHGYPRVVVGFAAESQDLLQNAQAKLSRKGVDFIVANDISAKDAGFGTDTNRVIILNKQSQEPLSLMSKSKISEYIIERIAKLLD